MNIPKMSIPRVVIVGGGFAGVALSKGLRNKEVQVVLIDRHNYHTFQPLLYQVATGGLEPGSIAFPLRKTLNDVDNYYYRLTEVQSVDAENKKNSPKIDSKKILKNKYGSKYIFWKYLLID